MPFTNGQEMNNNQHTIQIGTIQANLSKIVLKLRSTHIEAVNLMVELEDGSAK
jgi:hypothetical protein